MSYKMIIGEKCFPSKQLAAYTATYLQNDADYADCKTEIKEMDDGYKLIVYRIVKTKEAEK